MSRHVERERFESAREERERFELLPLATTRERLFFAAIDDNREGERREGCGQEIIFASISTDDTLARERGRESAATTSDNETSVDNDREGERRERCRRLQ